MQSLVDALSQIAFVVTNLRLVTDIIYTPCATEREGGGALDQRKLKHASV